MLMETILALEFKPQDYFTIINKMFDHLITKMIIHKKRRICSILYIG